MILYFSWVRDAVGCGEQTIDLPTDVITVSDLADHLATLSAGHAQVFAERARLRVAVDQVMAGFDATVVGAREIAFFPPVTGG